MMSLEDSAMVSTVTFEKTCSFQDKAENGRRVSSPEEGDRINGSCKEAKCMLVGFESLPEYLKDNEFILNYYRAEWPLKQTILSIFSIHNETLNIWTHLIGFFIFLALTIFAVMMVRLENPVDSANRHMMQPEVNASFRSTHNSLDYKITLPLAEMLPSLSSWYLPQFLSNHSDAATVTDRLVQQPITRWPFIAFLCGAMVCLFTSSACHLLSCHSEHCAYTMLRLDYTGISTLIVTSFYPLVYYTFMCDPFFCNLYIGFITTFGVATILVSLVPVFQTPEFRLVRALLFFCMAVSGLVPIMHRVVLFGDRPEALITTGYELVMGAFYALGVVVYATRVPERWMPGKFDLVGHSHQLFHVLVIAGAYTHYLAGLEYLKWRDLEGCS